MKNQPPTINIFEKVVRKASKGLIRDFGEIENLQIQSKKLGDFVTNADLKTRIFNKYRNEKNIFTSVPALIFLLKLKIITNIPVIIISKRALVALESFEIKGVG